MLHMDISANGKIQKAFDQYEYYFLGMELRIVFQVGRQIFKPLTLTFPLQNYSPEKQHDCAKPRTTNTQWYNQFEEQKLGQRFP